MTCSWFFVSTLLLSVYCLSSSVVLTRNRNQETGTKAGKRATSITLVFVLELIYNPNTNNHNPAVLPLRIIFQGHTTGINFQAPCVLYIGQAYRYSPEYSFYIFSQQIYLIIFFRLSLAIFFYSSTKCRVFPNVTLLGL